MSPVCWVHEITVYRSTEYMPMLPIRTTAVLIIVMATSPLLVLNFSNRTTNSKNLGKTSSKVFITMGTRKAFSTTGTLPSKFFKGVKDISILCMILEVSEVHNMHCVRVYVTSFQLHIVAKYMVPPESVSVTITVRLVAVRIAITATRSSLVRLNAFL